MSPRHTDVLMFGQSISEWMRTKTMMKGALQSCHMGWSYISNPRDTLRGALEYVAERKELQIVVIWNDINRPHKQMVEDCTTLAQALSKHQERPWVALTHDRLDSLQPIFEAVGLTVMKCFNEGIIFERWARHEVEHGHTALGVEQYCCSTCQSSIVRPAMMYDQEWFDFSQTFLRYHPSMNGVRESVEVAAA